jgi:hypothetical protein
MMSNSMKLLAAMALCVFTSLPGCVLEPELLDSAEGFEESLDTAELALSAAGVSETGRLRAKHSQLCLDRLYDGIEGAPNVQQPCNSSNSQWEFRYESNGYWSIRRPLPPGSPEPELCLFILAQSQANGAATSMLSCSNLWVRNGGFFQRGAKDSEGYQNIKSVFDNTPNKCLAIVGSFMNPGAMLYQFQGSSECVMDNQRFRLE